MFLDTGAFIVSFLLIGKAVEDRVIEESVKTSESIKSRMPKTLIVNRNQDRIEIPTKDIQEKDRFNVMVGEIIPVDGERLLKVKLLLMKAFLLANLSL